MTSAPPDNEPVVAYLGLGGNLGDPRSAMAQALRSLDAHPDIAVKAVSSLYKTPPWGVTEQPDFFNAAAKLRTSLASRKLLEQCLEAERRLKRVRAERWGPRLIDIDILWFGGSKIDEAGLQVPHPRMLERAFVLVPVAEIAPDLPLDGQRAAERARRIDRQGVVRQTGGRSWWRQD